MEATARATAPEDGATQTATHDGFQIAATASFHEIRPRTLKHNDTFAVFDHSGDINNWPGSSEGLYRHDTRHLSHYFLTLNGGIRPILLSSSIRDDNSVLTCDLSNPDIKNAAGEQVLQNDLIHLRRTRFIFDAKLYERLTLTNFCTGSCPISLELHFAGDFADLFEVRGATRSHRGTMLAPEVSADSVALGYTGLDDLTRRTRISFDPAPAFLSENLAVFRFALPPAKRTSILIEIDCEDKVETQDEPLRYRLLRSYRDTRQDLRNNSSRAAAVASSNEVFNQTVRRCVADTYMLVTDTEYGPFPYAGIPWYSTVFGRDALITALEMLWLDPAIARSVLGYLAANQATDFDPVADAEPGKILHEMRHGEMANLGEVPFRRYYGSIDSTPLFVLLAGAYLVRTNDKDTIDKIWPNIAAALKWIDTYGDRDGDGYVEYGRHSEGGLLNQGWKDSHDAVFHADGTIAKGPIALAEVQAYVFGAWQAAAMILERKGRTSDAEHYRSRAASLRDRFDRDFFDDKLGIYVLALDGEKKPCRARASNAGQVLFTGLALPERATQVVAALMEGGFFSGWGIRTVHSAEIRYNPMSYHNGSIWPHDNALIGSGFARYGHREEAGRILDGLFAASTYVDLRRLPELFCGFVRRPATGPTLYPVSCIPQAWSAAAQLSLLQSCLGLSIDAATKSIQFAHPSLPPFLDELTVRKLALGKDWVDLRLQRSGSKVLVEVLERQGDLEVLTFI